MDDHAERTDERRRPPTHPHVRLRRAATALHGVSSRSEAVRLGVADSTYEDWCRAEGCRRIHRGVVALPGTTDTPERRIAAAVLAAGSGAVAAGTTAMYLHDLDARPPSLITVLVPHARRAARLDGVEVRRTQHLDPVDVTEVRRLRCTTVERTVLDRVREVGWGHEGVAVVLTALQRRATDLESLGRLAQRVGPRRGRPLARVVHELDDGRTPDSILEKLVLEALLAAGLVPEPGWAVTIAGRRLRIDLAFPDARLAIECDGFAFHRSPRDLARDHERQNALVRGGWRVLRISWQRWQREPGAVIAEIRELLAA